MKTEKQDIIKTADNDIRKEVGSRIQSIRKQKDLSAETVAKNIGLSRVALTQIESGRNNVNAITLWKLACRLGCKIEEFFPKVPQGYGLSRVDINNIAKEDEKAVDWAKKLFGVKKEI